MADVWRQKENWGYVYGGPTEDIEAELGEVKLTLARAMALADAPRASADLAEDALGRAVALGEKLALGMRTGGSSCGGNGGN